MKYLILILIFFSSSLHAKDNNVLVDSTLNEEELCLVEAIYFEARSESFIGQLAVANVILERVSNKYFPNTICKVVKSGKYFKGNPVKYKCAFSYWCDGKSEKMHSYSSYDEALSVKSLALSGTIISITNKATHYHASYVNPKWSKGLKKLSQIGKHIFYK
jgi:spore germination cell wall hydrolase CwlJ-like protein|tara:strand:- start:22 stop:504 length:483 start_codon:yes stop_codon:yes gene_type:complete